MRLRRLAVVAFTGAAAMLQLSAATPAAAVECGMKPKGENRRALGALSLMGDVSSTTLDFGHGEDERTASLKFEVEGCRLTRKQVKRLDVAVGPAPDVAELPRDALSPPDGTVAAGDGAVSRRGSEIDVDLVVDPESFEPGTYGALVTVAGRGIATSRTPIVAERSEGNLWIPAGLGALGGLAGILWFLVLKFATAGNRIDISWWWIPVVILFAVVAGAVGGFLAWQSQEIWTVDDNRDDTLLAGFGGATTGAMAALLAAVGFSRDEDDGEQRT